MDVGLGDGIREALMFKKMAKGSNMFKNMGQSLIFTTIWAIWKARNDRIFNNIKKEPSEVVGEIKYLARGLRGYEGFSSGVSFWGGCSGSWEVHVTRHS
ncbi:hypothetical protein R6Q59_013271 [Mikania micrantha]